MRPQSTTAVAHLRWVALGAAELLAAHGEHAMAAQVGFHPMLAWLFPIALGVYAFCAFAAHSRTDVYAAIGLMMASQSLAHLLAVGVLPRHWGLVIAVSVVSPIICWRVHHLGEGTAPAVVVEVAPVAEVAPVPVSLAATEHPTLVAEPSAVAYRPALRVSTGVRVQRPRRRAVRNAAPARQQATRSATATRRSREETANLVAQLRAANPSMKQKDIAAELGLTPRWVRECAAVA